MSSESLHQPRLRAVTREIPAIEDVLEYALPHDPTVWSRRGDILVGLHGRHDFAYADSRQLADAWHDFTAAAEIDDEVRLPGTGLVAFGALPFDTGSPRGGHLSVPSVVLGRRGGRSWITRISGPHDLDIPDPSSIPWGPHWSPVIGPGTQTPERYQESVRRALAAIARGDAQKIVLARDLVGSIPAGSDLRRLVRALATAYPDTWTFAVDGLIGASPETLVTVSDRTVTARVLAGTIARGADADADTAASVTLATSTKDLDEHEFAVHSVVDALRPHTSALVAQEQPFMLKLPNVWHLATDVEGTLANGASALDLVGALHPTAAVAGTPTDAAIGMIRDLEPFDRGRYAGPVGWIDHNGDGEWAIALRCAQFDLHAIPPDGTDRIPFTAHAGAGIVAGSDPESEMLETRVKFRPIVDALA